jgi:hypothetical protein
LFALVAVLLTLMVQSKQLQATREELDNLKKEAKKSDIYRTLQVLENRLEELYREPIYFPSQGRLEESELYLLLSHATDDVPRKSHHSQPRTTVYVDETIMSRSTV